MARFLFPFDTTQKRKPTKGKSGGPKPSAKAHAHQARLALARHRGEQFVAKLRHAARGLN